MEKIISAPFYILQVKFKGMDEVQFYIHEDDYVLVKEKFCRNYSCSYITLNDIDNNFIYLHTEKIQSAYLLYEVRPLIQEIDYENDWYSIDLQLDNAEVLNIMLEGYETIDALTSQMSEGTKTKAKTNRFFSIVDVDGEDYFFNRDEVLYVKILHNNISDTDLDDDE